jgi:hypothetical protein
MEGDRRTGALAAVTVLERETQYQSVRCATAAFVRVFSIGDEKCCTGHWVDRHLSWTHCCWKARGLAHWLEIRWFAALIITLLLARKS